MGSPQLKMEYVLIYFPNKSPRLVQFVAAHSLPAQSCILLPTLPLDLSTRDVPSRFLML